MEFNNSVSLGTDFQENYKTSTEGGPTTGCKVASGIFIPIFFLVGVPGNFHVLQVLRRSEHILNQVTKWTLAHLAIFDLMSCLMNFPMLLAIATGGISNDEAVHILQITTVCFTNATVWKNCTCLILLALIRRDATIRAFLSQVITIQRLQKCLCVTWFVYFCIICSAFYVHFKVPYTFGPPRTTTRIIANQMTLSTPLMLISISLTLIYVIKSYFDIKSFLRTQADNMETYITIYQTNARRQHERRICRAMLQVAVVLAVTAVPPAIMPIFHETISIDVCVIARCFTLLSQVTNPFIYSTISEDFLRFLPFLTCSCLERNHSVNTTQDKLAEQVSPLRITSSGQEFSKRLDIKALEEDLGESDRDNGKQFRKNLLKSQIIFVKERADSQDTGAPDISPARFFISTGQMRS